MHCSLIPLPSSSSLSSFLFLMPRMPHCFLMPQAPTALGWAPTDSGIPTALGWAPTDSGDPNGFGVSANGFGDSNGFGVGANGFGDFKGLGGRCGRAVLDAVTHGAADHVDDAANAGFGKAVVVKAAREAGEVHVLHAHLQVILEIHSVFHVFFVAFF